MKEITKLVEEQTSLKVLGVKELHGGMSNFNYLVLTANKKFVVRVPGDYAEKFVDREIEKYHIDLIKETMINQNVIYFDVESGIKISEYVDGVSLDQADFKPSDISEVLKKYHHLNSNYDYNPFERIKLFESYLTNQSDQYFVLRSELANYQEYLLKQKTVFCHNDSQPFNMIKSQEKIYLLDWEYAGNNDPMYDLVCFTEDFGADSSFAKELITSYFGYYDLELEKRKLLWTIFQMLQWYNVALFKDNNNMSEKLGVNFLEVCDYFLETAQQKLEQLRRIENES